MTDEEKQQLRDLKAITASWLRSFETSDDIARYRYALEDTDKRLRTYVDMVAYAPDDHNLYELLAVKRFFYLLDHYKFRPDKVTAFYRFYESMKFSGQERRQSYKLTPVQCFQIASIFGLWIDDEHRLTRTAYLFVPRKFSKTTFAAALAVNELFTGDNNAQAYVGANGYQQAKICFDEIRAIIRGIDPKEKLFRVNRERVSWRDENARSSFAECLSNNAKTKDGLNASLVIMDEYSQARNTKTKNGADLKNTLTSSMGARINPLTLVITTASEVLDGPFAHELAGVEAVLRGEQTNDRMFASLFMPDVDDAEDDPHTWRKVQPHMGVTVQPDFYATEWENAQLSAENMMTFRTKLLNIFAINEEKTWWTPRQAQSLIGDFNVDKLPDGAPIVVSIDLSVHDDLTCIGYTYYDQQNKHFYIHNEYYLPEEAVKEHPNHSLYKLWHEQGYLKYCKGEAIDVYQIANEIYPRTRMNILSVAYDRYQAQDLTNIIRKWGAPDRVQSYNQMWAGMSPAVNAFEMGARMTPPRITFNNNPINAYCLENCKMIESPDGLNRKPMKASPNQKIDGAITALMGVGRWNELLGVMQ